VKTRFSGWVAVLLVATLASLAQAENEIGLVDQTGRSVVVSQPVERIASVYGSGTYFLYTLGVGDRLVAAWYTGVKGLSQAWDAMFRLEPRLADILCFGDPNVEELAAREPDLILADGARHAAFSETMTNLGIPTIQYLVETPDTLVQAMTITGEALGGDAKARAVQFGDDFARILDTAARDVAAVPDDERPRVLFVGTSPLQVAGGDMYQTLLVEAAGGRSVAAHLVGSWNTVNLEQVLVWNPDVIVIAPYGSVTPSTFLDSPDWQSVRAVAQGRVYRMPRVVAPMDTPVPESVLGIVWLAGVLYPERTTLDMATEATAFYSTYYGYALSAEELAHLAGR
jgi:ABC-type Fe3+-hydroxamate transport system substrate-binding protein